MLGAELPKWVRAAQLKHVLRSGVLCLASNEAGAENTLEPIYVLVHLHVPLYLSKCIADPVLHNFLF